MLSRLRANQHLFRNFQQAVKRDDSHLLQNIISKRWSGHRTMDVVPSNWDWKLTKNWTHFYVLLAFIPYTIISVIINIRANPELIEVPEGYEPRHWEYYKHPVTRFLAKHVYMPQDIEHELHMAACEYQSEERIIKKIQQRVDKVMTFYSDHRSYYFVPYYADYYRHGRQDNVYNQKMSVSMPNQHLEYAYDPNIKAVPVEGYGARNTGDKLE